MTDRDLFISHSSSDADAARSLRAMLEAAGYTCWMAPDDVTGTDPWASQILAAIQGSRAMLVVISERSNGSAHVAREVELANARGRIVLPLRVEEVRPSGALEYHIAGLQRTDAFPPPIDRHRDAILRRVASTVPLVAPAGPVPVPSSEPSPEPSPQPRSQPSRGIGAWARANSMLAGVAVTLAALFVVGAVALALSGAGPGASGPSGTGGGATTVPATEHAAASATAAATTTGTFGPAPSRARPAIGAGGAFPSAAEVDLYMALPFFAARTIEDCSREDGPPTGIVAAIWCYTATGEHVLYEQWPDVATVRAEYHTSLRITLDNPVGSCATDPMGDSAWQRDGQVAGRLACHVYDAGPAETFIWTDEARRVIAWWFGSGSDEPGGDHVLGNALFQAWTAE